MAWGYPMHKYCYKQSDRLGCPGVPNNKYTLSSRGFPCFWDNEDTRCAWCSPGGYQCGPGQKTGPESKQGSRCARGRTSTIVTVLLETAGIFPPVMLMLTAGLTDHSGLSTSSSVSARKVILVMVSSAWTRMELS